MPARSVGSAADDAVIERKLAAVLYPDDTGSGVIGRASTYPRWKEAKALTETEIDLRDWGVVYGMTFALMFSEGSWEPVESAAERAVDVAWRVFQAWGSGIAEPIRSDEGTPVSLTVDQRAALAVEIAETVSDGRTLAEFVAEHGPLLSVAEAIYRLPDIDRPAVVRLAEPEAVEGFVRATVGEIDAMLAEDLDEGSKARQRQRREVLDGLLGALSKGEAA